MPGEIETTHEFYSYEAKYLDPGSSKYYIPAMLESLVIKKIQKLALESYKQLRCEGMARIDFFLKPNGEILINELNTIPGFTSTSLYPVLWKASGISYTELLDRLIDLALDRHKKKEKLENNFHLSYCLKNGNQPNS